MPTSGWTSTLRWGRRRSVLKEQTSSRVASGNRGRHSDEEEARTEVPYPQGTPDVTVRAAEG